MVLPGCLGPRWIFNDPWNEDDAIPSMPLDETDVVKHWPVRKEMQSEAQAQLAQAKFVRITEDEATRLGGEVPDDPVGGAPYLVRAVYLFWGGPGFCVYYRGREVVVTHTSMGTGTAWRVKRCALIVRLKMPPTRVITKCGIMV